MQHVVDTLDDEAVENFETSEDIEKFEEEIISQDENLDENEASVQEENSETIKALPVAKSLKDGKSCRLKTEGEKLSKIIHKAGKVKKTEPQKPVQADVKKSGKSKERTKRNAKVQQKPTSDSAESRKRQNTKSRKSTLNKKNDKSSSSNKKASSKSNKSSKKSQQKKKPTKYEL